MRFLYIKVLQILNQVVDLMLRIVGNVPRVSHLTGIFTQLWGDNAIDVPQRNFGWGTCPPCPSRDLRTLDLTDSLSRITPC